MVFLQSDLKKVWPRIWRKILLAEKQRITTYYFTSFAICVKLFLTIISSELVTRDSVVFHTIVYKSYISNGHARCDIEIFRKTTSQITIIMGEYWAVIISPHMTLMANVFFVGLLWLDKFPLKIFRFPAVVEYFPTE